MEQNNYQKIYPLLFGLLAYLGIRLVTDAYTGIGGPNYLLDIILCTTLSYLFYFYFIRFLSRLWRIGKTSPELLKEFTGVVLSILVGTTTILGTLRLLGFNTLGNPIPDLIVCNTISVFLMVMQYLILRNQELSRQQLLQLEETKRDQLQTELSLLKAQYHPHFLFNALNTVYFQIDEENLPAKRSVELLSDLLRYQLYHIDNKIAIDKEISYLQSYIEFQQLRSSERLQLEIHIDPTLKKQLIHPLLIQPLVENAFKYIGGEYRIIISLRTEKNGIQISIYNSTSTVKQKNKTTGIGLANLQRRLSLLYPRQHILKTEKGDNFYQVQLFIQLT